tara:strand:- start:284 stop:994 length:711 start_codon:yes stop_codon:yes gene_type:complete
MFCVFFLQSDTLLSTINDIPNTVGESISIIELLTTGGIAAQVIIGVLFILSIITVYLFFERYFSIKSALNQDHNFLNNIKDFLYDSKYSSAIDLCRNVDTPISRLLEKGIHRIDKSLEDITISIDNACKLELYKLENNLAIIGTIAGVGPMIGFLGTVIGMVLAFFEMASAGGQIDIEMLSKGIYTAMTTTVVGLMVGIIAYVSYNYLVSKVSKAIYQMESVSIEFLDIVYSKKNS